MSKRKVLRIIWFSAVAVFSVVQWSAFQSRNLPSNTFLADALVDVVENDGLASVEEVLENEHKLPQGSALILVEGGNHSQFGYLGKLFMDNSADISLESQQEEALNYLIRHFINIETSL